MKEVLDSLQVSAGSLQKKIAKLINIYNCETERKKSSLQTLIKTNENRLNF
jgi:hypothetical protein